MTVPQSKLALLADAAREFDTLQALISSMTVDERDAPLVGGSRDRDVADVLNHLHAWHELLLGWVAEASVDRAPAFPAEGHTWTELDALNLHLRDQYLRESSDAALARLRGSHMRVTTVVEGLSDAELFDVARYPWLRGQLAEPVHECLGAHYRWAVAAIVRARDVDAAPKTEVSI
ncbi:MAG TPA: ClbS/DfsB family four-helix bundle protein [Candidatus Lumbricidophila sp.]|nr:ClbS/DfsB family four-helix bundle protein [Candidatus Lumbricidophila sp.]